MTRPTIRPWAIGRTIVASADVVDAEPIRTLGGPAHTFAPDFIRIEWRVVPGSVIERVTVSGPALNADGTYRGRAPARGNRQWQHGRDLDGAPQWVRDAAEHFRAAFEGELNP